MQNCLYKYIVIILINIFVIFKNCSAHLNIVVPQIHKCCEFQFQFHYGKCEESGFEDKIIFPEYLFGKYRLTQSGVVYKEKSKRVSYSLESLSMNLTEQGYFLYGRTYVPPSQYCFDSLGSTQVDVILYTSSFDLFNTQQEQLINKCCEMDYSYDVLKKICFRSKDPWRRLVQTSSGKKLLVENIILGCIKLQNFTNVKFWDHPVRFDIENTSFGRVSLKYQSQGGVFLRGVWKTLKDNFCIDQLQGNEDFNNSNLTMTNSQSEIVFYCADDEKSPSVNYANVLGCMWIFTSILLVVTSVINVLIIQRNVHGYVLFGYLLSSAILNVMAGVFIIIADDKKFGCSFIDFAQKFFYLSTLCWMTMVNFDLWWDFRKLEPNARKSMKRLPCYIFVAWTLPLLIMTVCWMIGTNKRLQQELPHCVLYDYGIFFYSSGPVVILIIFNSLLFIRTTIIIRGLRKSTRKVLQHSRRQSESFKLFSKLFLMTGPIWILRVILLAVQIKGTYLSWYGVLLEVIFIIPDIIFFLLVVCHRKVVERLRKNLPWLKEIAELGILCCPQSLPHPPDRSSSARSSPRYKIKIDNYKAGRSASFNGAESITKGIELYVISNVAAAATTGNVNSSNVFV